MVGSLSLEGKSNRVTPACPAASVLGFRGGQTRLTSIDLCNGILVHAHFVEVNKNKKILHVYTFHKECRNNYSQRSTVSDLPSEEVGQACGN